VRTHKVQKRILPSAYPMDPVHGAPNRSVQDDTLHWNGLLTLLADCADAERPSRVGTAFVVRERRL